MELIRRLQPEQCRFLAFIACASIFAIGLVMGLLVLIMSIAISYHVTQKNFVLATAQDVGIRRRRLAALGLAAACTVGGTWIATKYGIREPLNTQALFEKAAEVTTSLKGALPQYLSGLLPQPDHLLDLAAAQLREHAAEIGSASLGAAKQAGYLLVGLLVGAMIACSRTEDTLDGPIARDIFHQADQFRLKLLKVIKAQATISFINTNITAIYLFVALPHANIDLPFRKTMIVCTFVLGLIPIIGNIASNIIITLISLGHSAPLAFISLAFSITIHKLEWLMNARIVSANVESRSWEILLSMLLMERIFGLPGVIAAPVAYAWAKSEWLAWDRPRTADTNTERTHGLPAVPRTPAS